ncbi:hypothetical protein [Streptodolium elevatio]
MARRGAWRWGLVAVALLLTVTGCRVAPGVQGTARDVRDAGVFEVLGENDHPPDSTDLEAVERVLGILLLSRDWGKDFVMFDVVDFSLWATPSVDEDCRISASALPEGTPAGGAAAAYLPRPEHLRDWASNEDKILESYRFFAQSSVAIHKGPLVAGVEIDTFRDTGRRCGKQFNGDVTYHDVRAVVLDKVAGYDEVVADGGYVVAAGFGPPDGWRFVDAVARKGNVVVRVYLDAPADSEAEAREVGSPLDLDLRERVSAALAMMSERLLVKAE